MHGRVNAFLRPFSRRQLPKCSHLASSNPLRMHIARLQQRPVPMPHRRLQTPPIVKHLRMIRRKGMPQDVLTPCLKARCRAQSAPPPVPIWRTDENRLPLCPLRIITPQPCQHGARQRHLPTAARLALPRANPHLPSSQSTSPQVKRRTSYGRIPP